MLSFRRLEILIIHGLLRFIFLFTIIYIFKAYMEGKDQPVDFKRVYTNKIVSELIRFSASIDKFYTNIILVLNRQMFSLGKRNR